MPRVFNPYDGSSPREPHTTFYQVFVGKGAAFEQRLELRFTSDFPNGRSNTILIVEAGRAVPWTKPEDLPYADDQPLPKLGGLFHDSFRAAFADGHVQGFMHDESEASLRARIARNEPR
jgi:hypothetical protein